MGTSLAPVESSVFALLAGFTNFGDAVSSYVGSYTLQALGLGGIGKGQVDNFRSVCLRTDLVLSHNGLQTHV